MKVGPRERRLSDGPFYDVVMRLPATCYVLALFGREMVEAHRAIAQAPEHFDLLTPGHHPKCAPCAIDRRIGQSHSTPAHIDSGDGYVPIGDIEYLVPRN